MPNQNQSADVDSSMPEPKNQASGRRRLLRNIVAIGAMGALGGLLFQERTGLVPSVEAACLGHVDSGTCNSASGFCAVVAGGHKNRACGFYATVGGGYGNTASFCSATVGGGWGNGACNFGAFVGGGGVDGLCSMEPNVASGAASTIPGGFGNTAAAKHSFAAGYYAFVQSSHNGAMLFSDDSSKKFFKSSAPDEFAVRATGGFRFVTAICSSTGCPTHSVVITGGATPSLQEWRSCTALSRVDKVGSFNVDTNHTNDGSQLNNGSSTGIGLYFGDPCSGEGISSNRSSNSVKDLEFWTNHTARMTVANCGNVGIGTTTPEAPLTVVSPTTITAALIGSSQGNLIFAKSGTNGFSMYSNAANYLGFYSNDSGIQPLTMNGSGVAVGNAYKSTAPPTNGAIIEGSVGIGTSAPTQTLSVQGTAGKSCGGSTWATFSDRRWKCPDSFRPFTEGLAWVRSLPPPMRFRYAEGNGIGADPRKEHVNFVAQCLLDGVHGTMVSEIQAKLKTSDKEPTTTYAVNVSDMHFAMLNAIKELAEQNQKLAGEKKALREELIERIEKLERQVAAG